MTAFPNRLCAASLVAAALILVTAGSGSPGRTQATAANPVMARGVAIRDRFIAAIRACGFRPTAIPAVVVKTEPQVVYYSGDDRSVHLSRWAELPPGMQGMMTAWAAKGTLGLTPEGMFGEIFNDLLVAHELGHFLQDMSGRAQKLDRWESELEANRIAIAFFSLRTGDRTRLPARIDNFAAFLNALPNPVPAGQDPRAYFQANYEKLGGDPQAYGWFQGLFMRKAWDGRGERDFCGWVKVNSPFQTPPKPKPKPAG